MLECNFSTTTPITHTASHVVMMNAFQKYFDYVMYCVCGIPEITLLGTVEDWQSISDRTGTRYFFYLVFSRISNNNHRRMPTSHYYIEGKPV
ncbi:DUF4419 domain-containing protein [Nostoc sp.]|uniref:DUF4419 domain-containing protein n=1 Tax=Nostoc sp. TaxID=1180 RepID=UPI003FA52DEA